MLLIKAYYVFFSAFMFAIAGICQVLSWIHRLPVEGMFKMRPRHRRGYFSAMRIEERMFSLRHLF